MNLLKNGIKIIIWRFFMLRGMFGLSKSSVLLQQIRQSLSETIFNQASAEEKSGINEIEQIRKKFTGNPTAVDIVDFGAGLPDSSRSENEMRLGVTHSTTYGEISLGSKPPLWAFFLFRLSRNFKPSVILELGTCIGISAAYQATALKLNKKGKLISIEGSEVIAELARKNIDSLHIDNVRIINGRFMDVLSDVLKQNQPVDYVFIDGHHDGQATLEYFEMLLPHLSNQALLIFDDISWSDGMKQAWKTISKHKSVSAAVDLGMIGVCVC
jgi:predicted O-methyltransferase YrrM